MKINELQNKTILILGYGKEGQGTERFLKSHAPSSKIIVADKSTDANYLEKQHDADIVIKTPSIPSELLSVPYTTATNLFFANNTHMKIGVTGSKGKSTTASLIYAMLKQAGKHVYLVGNIGTPMLDYLSMPIEDDAIFVCELSSYQLQDLQYSPHISVIVSLFPDHIDYHGSVETYYEAKHQIIKHAKAEDYFVYNPQFPLLAEWAHQAPCKNIPFISDMPPTVKDIPLLGEHNRSNLRGAITAVKILDISDEDIAQAVKTFVPLRHRLQKVGTYQGITFYDDAISTTPESTIAALNALANVKTIFLGGQNRGYDFAELAKVIIEKKIENIVLFPDSGEDIWAEIQKVGIMQHHNILQTDSMEAAIIFAYQHTPKGAVCLLSTASPSYSVWKNFEEKGDQFQLFVQKLGNATL